MKDAILHVLLGLVYALFVCLIIMVFPWPLNVFMIAAGIVFIREVSQKQEDLNSDYCKICTGWDFWNWSKQKKFETWFPMLILVLIGLALLEIVTCGFSICLK